jgi:uncharacterized membrane protein YcaP (DUF421 family)
MSKYTIYWNDFQRIFQGEVPWEFYIELIIRAVVVYLILITSFRLMGKRMATQLTRNELAAISSLAAAIGIPLQTPDRGLIPGILVAAIVVIVQRLVANRSVKSEKFEQLTQGKISTLVQDSFLQIDDMEECRISRERIFSQLRSNDIRQLGEVERLYLEANGNFTLIKNAKPGSGLSVLPDIDKEFTAEQETDQTKLVCNHCGHQQNQAGSSSCPNCRKDEWVKAVR